MGRGRFGGMSYRRLNYRQNYESEKQNDMKETLPVLLVIGIFSPFIAAIILNPYMWIMVFLVWLAWKLVHGFKKGE